VSATYLVDGKPVDLDTARRAFEQRNLDTLAALLAAVVIRQQRDRPRT